MQITRAGSHDSGDVKHQQSKKTVPSSQMTQRSHSAKGVAGGKGDGADNAPIPMPLVSHEMRENGC